MMVQSEGSGWIMTEPIRIVLAEDYSLVRDGTRRILEQQDDLKVIGEAGNGEEALELIKCLRPDIAILDIRMPCLSGVEVVRRMKACSPSTKALILTAYDDDEYILALMEAGASGYLLKTVRANELIEAVRSINIGKPVLHPAIAMKVARLWSRRQSSMERGRKAVEELSQRELEVLDLAAKGLRNKAIAENLGISVRTVEGHLSSILTKLNVTSRIEAILYAASQHWISLDQDKV